MKHSFCQNWEIAVKSQRSFTENLTETARWGPPRKATCHLFRTFNSYSFTFKGGLICNRHTGYCPYRAPCPGACFLWFFLMTSCDLTLFYSFLTQANVCYLSIGGDPGGDGGGRVPPPSNFSGGDRPPPLDFWKIEKYIFLYLQFKHNESNTKRLI